MASYLLLGLSILLILTAVRAAFHTVWRILLAAAAVMVLVFTLKSSPTFLGETSWYNASPWKECLAFLAMILGMTCRTISLAIEKRRAQLAAGQVAEKLVIDKWEMIYPFLVSFITFGGVQSQLADQHFGVQMAVFAFQNGFFWQTLIGHIEARATPR